MKKIVSLSILFVSVVVIACSPKTTTAVAATPTTPTANVTTAQVDAAKTKFPEATMETLTKGYNVYYGASCTGCHGAKKITNFEADELPTIINRMAKKAGISDEEKDAVLKYVIGVKLASSAK